MPNRSKPWFRAQTNAWVSVIDGRQRTLAKGRENYPQALMELHRLLEERQRPEKVRGDLSLIAMRDVFLDAMHAEVSPELFASYRQWTLRFCDFLGRERPAAKVIPHDLTRFLGMRPKRGKPWSRSSRATATQRVKRMFGWAEEQGLIASDPLARVKIGGSDQRDCAVPGDLLDRVVEAAGPVLGPYLRFLRTTGCRPSEAARLTAAHIDLTAGTATMRGKTTRRTGRQRVLYLSDQALAIVRPLMALHPEGPLFRSSRGNAWFPGSLCDRFETLRRRVGLGPELVPESFRHAYATEAAFRLLPAELAALMGSSVKTVMRFYVHASEKTAELRAAAQRAREDRVRPHDDARSPDRDP